MKEVEPRRMTTRETTTMARSLAGQQATSGKVGRGALAFPVSSWVSISGVGVLPMTLSAWHQRNDTLEGGYCSMFAGASGNYYLFFLNGSDAAAMWISNPSAAAYGFGYTEPNDGQWHLYTVVINSASSQSLYVDGAFISTVNSGLNLTTYPVRFLGAQEVTVSALWMTFVSTTARLLGHRFWRCIMGGSDAGK